MDMEIDFTTQIFKEGRMFVAYTRELDLSSCATTRNKAVSNLKQAVTLFLEEAEKMGTLGQILDEAGYTRRKTGFSAPKLITTQRISLPLPPEPAPRPITARSPRFRTKPSSVSSRPKASGAAASRAITWFSPNPAYSAPS